MAEDLDRSDDAAWTGLPCHRRLLLWILGTGQTSRHLVKDCDTDAQNRWSVTTAHNTHQMHSPHSPRSGTSTTLPLVLVIVKPMEEQKLPSKMPRILMNRSCDTQSEPYMAILDQRNTPTQGMMHSPAQRMMSRRTRTLLPTRNNLLKQEIIDPTHVKEILWEYTYS